mmetsp:Transcript_11849/g.29923  ORF Transcript_11849/g.29923 Transcript_11849/m.29923 type:complete len:209 (-) Transcript_11849:2011-2637(-)
MKDSITMSFEKGCSRYGPTYFFSRVRMKPNLGRLLSALSTTTHGQRSSRDSACLRQSSARMHENAVSSSTVLHRMATAAYTQNACTAGMRAAEPIANPSTCDSVAVMMEGATREKVSPMSLRTVRASRAMPARRTLFSSMSYVLTSRNTLSDPMASTRKGMTSEMMSVACMPNALTTPMEMRTDRMTMTMPAKATIRRERTNTVPSGK